jgi:hypothetical protein
LDSTGSGQGPVAGCCKCGDEPSGSCATELVSYNPFRFWSGWSATVSDQRFSCLPNDLFPGGLYDVISFGHLVSVMRSMCDFHCALSCGI